MTKPLPQNLSLEEKRTLLARLLQAESQGQAEERLQKVDGAPIVPDPSRWYEPFPLADIQQAYFLGRSGEFDLGNNGIHGWIEVLCENLDVNKLDSAWNRTLAYHQMLRAVVLPGGRQRILEIAEYRIERVDLRDLDAEARQAWFADIREQQSHFTYDPHQWPLFRIIACLLSPGVTHLLISFDGLHIDLWSLQQVFDNWIGFYQDPSYAPSAFEISYRDYVLAIEARHRSEDYQRSLAYWKERVCQLPPAPELPAVKSPASIVKPRYVRRSVTVESRTWHRIKEQAHLGGVTPSTAVLTAYAEALRNWSASSRFTLNVTLFNRLLLHPQIRRLAGNFSSMLFLAVEDGGGSFLDRAGRLRQQLWRDLEHREASGIPALRELARFQGRPAAWQFPFVFTSVMGTSAYRCLGKLGTITNTVTMTPQVALDHQLIEEDGHLLSSWDSVDELFPAGLMDDVWNAYRDLLLRLDDARVWTRRSFPMAPDQQLRSRQEANLTGAPVAPTLPHQVFEDWARRKPDHPAIVTLRCNFTYRETDRRANRLARLLRERGVGPDDCVPIIMEKGWEQVVGVLSVFKSGGAYVPLDAHFPRERIRLLVEQTNAKAILTQSRFAPALSSQFDIPIICVDSSNQGVEDGPLAVAQSDRNLAFILFTSGSTGTPKGVMIEQRSVVNRITNLTKLLPVTAEDRTFGLTALHHDMSVLDILAPLCAGGSILLPDAQDIREPSSWARLLEDASVTIWNSVPAFMEMLLNYLEGTQAMGSRYVLRTILLGGDFIPLTMPGRIRALLPGADIYSVGGPTETGIMDIAYRIGDLNPTWKSIPYGKPLANTRYHILNEEMNPCPVWVPGEMYISGIGLARGYFRDAGKTAAAFVPHPVTGERCYRSGDLGRYGPDGNIEILGRKDRQVKIRGHRIELEEIRATLAALPAVRDAAVIVEDGPHGRHLQAYVVLNGAMQHLDLLEAAFPRDSRTGVLDPLDRLNFKLENRGIRHDLDVRATVELPKLADDEELRRVWFSRQSWRWYKKSPIPLDQIGRLLSCLMQVHHESAPLGKYRYPSGGNLYPIQTYLYVKRDRVASLDKGLYYYHPREHRLLCISDITIDETVHYSANMPIFEASAFSIFLIARMAAIEPMYGCLARDLCLLESGYIGQLLMMEAAEQGLGICPIGALDFPRIRNAFRLDEDDELVHSFVGGLPDTSPPVRPSHTVDAGAALQGHLAKTLPEYMIPETVHVIDALPLSPNGKLDYGALSARTVEMRRPEPAPRPSSPAGALVAALWGEILETSVPKATDNFFQEGGDSLSATRLVVRLQEALGREISLRTLFENPTLAGFIAALERSRARVHLPLHRVDRSGGPPPLSYAQQRLWSIQHLYAGNHAYSYPVAYRVEGMFDLLAFEKSLNAIVTRHEALRTTFPSRDGQASQRIAEAAFLSIPLIDLSGLTEEVVQSRLDGLIAQEVKQSFDLAEGPLLRASIYRLQDDEHVLFLNVHHIVADEWSQTIFMRELGEFYEAFVSGGLPAPGELPLQYVDFSQCQRRWLDEGLLQEQLSFWEQELSDPYPAVELPANHPRQAVQIFHGARETFPFPAPLVEGLRALSRTQGVTLFMTLLAGFYVLLRRYTGLDDLPVGVPTANRTHREVERLIGFFANMIVLRTNLSGNPTVRELLVRVRETTLNAHANQDIPFEVLVDHLRQRRDLSHNPLFQVAFAVQTGTPAPQIAGLRFTPLPLDAGSEHFDLTLFVEDRQEGMRAALRYNTDLFEQPTIARMGRHWRNVLAAMVDGPDQRIGDIAMVETAERALDLTTSHGQALAFDASYSIHNLVELQAEHAPDQVALVTPQGEQLTYRELDSRAEQVALILRGLGVGPDVFTGIYMERSVKQVIAILAILKAGGAFVPLGADYPRERLEFMIRDTGIRFVLTDERLSPSLPGQAVPICIDSVPTGPPPEAARRCHCERDSAAYVIYTSGSTGIPKGVVITHGDLSNYFQAMIAAIGFKGSDVYLHTAPLNFNASYRQIFLPLLQGATVLFADTDTVQSPPLLFGAIKRHGATVMDIVPSYWNVCARFLKSLPEETRRGLLDNRLRLLLSASEPLPGITLATCLDLFPGRRFINMYGQTETAGIVTLFTVPPDFEPGRTTPLGVPIPNMQAYILDENLQPVPEGVYGDLWVGGEDIARGYLNRPELTAERFVPDPFGSRPGARLYYSGDIVRRRNGSLEFVSRADLQVKVRGFRVEIAEVEAVLDQHRNVKESAIRVLNDSDGRNRLVAYVVANHEEGAQSLNAGLEVRALRERLRTHLKDRLPEYMHPALFVFLDELPRTAGGKIDRTALTDPDLADFQRAEPTPPRTDLEQRLAAIWAKVLRIDDISVFDNFFDLGGDSILAIQIASLANTQGLYFSLKQLFQNQTIAELVQVLSEKMPVRAAEGELSGPVPLTPIQRWFFDLKQPEAHHWNMSVLLRARRPLRPGPLGQALDLIVRHHDALRMRFSRDGSAWRQTYADPPGSGTLEVCDLSAIADDDFAGAVTAAAAAAQASLDLNRGPLFRAVLFKGGQRPDQLLLVIHHLVTDGVSYRILLDDLQAAYLALESGRQFAIGPKTTSFRAWGERLIEYAQSERADSELAYWTGAVPTNLPAIPRDFDLPPEADMAGDEQIFTVRLSREQTHELLRHPSRAFNSRVDETLFAAMGFACCRWTGWNEVLIEMEGHGRELWFDDVDLSRTVGWFTIACPLLLRLDPLEPVGKTLTAVKENMRKVPGRGFGYMALRYLSPEKGAVLETLARPEIRLNYLGQFDQILPPDSLFDLSDIPLEAERASAGRRPHPLRLDAYIVRDRLHLDFKYNPNAHSRVTVENLARDFCDFLEAILAECREIEGTMYSPSDFPEAGLDADELAEVLKQIQLE